MSFSVQAQTNLCQGDTLYLQIGAFRGNLQWQVSSDSLNWTDISGANYQPYLYVVSSTQYFRSQVTDGTCNPVYSPVQKVIVTNCCTSVKCGNQVWACANLNTGTFVLANNRPLAGNQKWCYNDIEANCEIYGGLYDWADVMGYPAVDDSTLTSPIIKCDPCSPASNPPAVRGMCPQGYHIPSIQEWTRYEFCVENNIAPKGNTSLAAYTACVWSGNWCGSEVPGVGPGDKIKGGGIAVWGSADNSNNNSGFNALPAGFYQCEPFNHLNPRFAYGGPDIASFPFLFASYWTSTDAFYIGAMDVEFRTDKASSFLNSNGKTNGQSVRCLKD